MTTKKFDFERPVHLWHQVSPRHRDVLLHLIAGSTNGTIAQALGITEMTVKEHMQALLARLGAVSRQQLAVWAAIAMIDDGEGDLRKVKEISEFGRCQAALKSEIDLQIRRGRRVRKKNPK